MAKEKLHSYKEFKTNFATSPDWNTGQAYLRPMTLKFHCSDHRLDIELGRRNQTPRSERSCRFCALDQVGDEYRAFQNFQYSYFMGPPVCWWYCTVPVSLSYGGQSSKDPTPHCTCYQPFLSFDDRSDHSSHIYQFTLITITHHAIESHIINIIYYYIIYVNVYSVSSIAVQDTGRYGE